MSLILDRVSVTFEGKTVLQDFSCSIADGERVCFFGPSGQGKTTLLRVIAGLIHPDSGTVTGCENAVFSMDFQENRLLPWYTVEKNLLLNMTDKSEVSRWLNAAGIPDAGSLMPAECSGGMLRRIALIRALAFPSDVLVLDEPLRELDRENRDAMLKLIEASIGARTLLLVTHSPEEAEALGCRLISLR